MVVDLGFFWLYLELKPEERCVWIACVVTLNVSFCFFYKVLNPEPRMAQKRKLAEIEENNVASNKKIHLIGEDTSLVQGVIFWYKEYILYI